MKKLTLLSITLLVSALVQTSLLAEEKSTAKENVVQIMVPEMVCQGCSSSVTKALTSLEGVSKATVNLKHKVALISTKSKMDDKALTQAIEDTGYKVQKIEHLKTSFKKAKEELDKKEAETAAS